MRLRGATLAASDNRGAAAAALATNNRGAAAALAILVILGGVLPPGWTEARPRRPAPVAAAAPPVCSKLRARLDAMAVEDRYRALQPDLEDCLRRDPTGEDPRYNPFRLYDTHNLEARSSPESLVGRYEELVVRGGLSAAELAKLNRWLQGLRYAAAFAECRAGTDKGNFCQANPSCERAVTLGSFDVALAWPALFLSARSHLECRQPQVARERCQQALALAEAARSAEQEQQARLCLCRAALALRDQREQAQEQGQKALALAKARGDAGARREAMACLVALPPPPPPRPPRVRDQRRLAVGYTVLTLGVLALAAGGALVATDCTAVTSNPVNGGSCISSYGRATPGYVLLGGGGLLAAIGLPLAVIATIGKPGPTPTLTVSALARF